MTSQHVSSLAFSMIDWAWATLQLTRLMKMSHWCSRLPHELFLVAVQSFTFPDLAYYHLISNYQMSALLWTSIILLGSQNQYVGISIVDSTVRIYCIPIKLREKNKTCSILYGPGELISNCSIDANENWAAQGVHINQSEIHEFSLTNSSVCITIKVVTETATATTVHVVVEGILDPDDIDTAFFPTTMAFDTLEESEGIHVVAVICSGLLILIACTIMIICIIFAISKKRKRWPCSQLKKSSNVYE